MTERLDPHGHAPAWAEGRLAPGGGPVQGQLEPEGYIPVPDEFREKLVTAISEIS